jgi:phage-related tail protein
VPDSKGRTLPAKGWQWFREQRYEILSKQNVWQMPGIAVGTTKDVLATLQKTKVSKLQAISDALPTRFSNALEAAAKLLGPKAQSVNLPSGTIKNEDDLKTWLHEAEGKIREKLKEGPVIVYSAKRYESKYEHRPYSSHYEVVRQGVRSSC